MRLPAVLLSWIVCLFVVTPALAQQADQPAASPGSQATPTGTGNRLLDRLNQRSQQYVCNGDYCLLTGQVELPLGTETTLFADQIELFLATNRVIAQGNVVFASPEGRLSAERLEYDAENGTGTFQNAFGLMALGAQADRRQFGNQEADVMFYGETIQKLGTRRYRLTRGAFTTCVQPTPRWEVASTAIDLDLNNYATARNTVLKVKGVPVVYLPMIYYPLNEEQRSTGFLLPTYGTSTIRGQAISNAFFWAINRSTDATFFHDWFTRSGQGAGAEYRYVATAQSSGDVRFYRFDQKQITEESDGETSTLPATTSYEISGGLNHALTRNIRARARLDYFTSLITQQLYHQNLYQATRNRRVIEAGLTAAMGSVSSSLLYQRSELFSSPTRSQVYGSTPRITTSLAPQRLFNAPIYASANVEYAHLPDQSINEGAVVSDNSYRRLDISPTVRIPMSRLTFLSVNTSAAYRTTHYSRSAALSTEATIDEPYLRQYMTLRSDIVGPVFTRIWDLQSGFAERLKHVIEPAFTVDFTSHIDNYNRTPVVSDLSDFVVSGATKVTYGVTNRVFARGRTTDNSRGSTREILTVGLQQTYYSNPESGGFDSSYQSTYGTRRLLDLSPIALTARVSPAAAVDTNMRLEYDVAEGLGLRTVSFGGNMNAASFSAGANYSHSRLDPENHTNFIQGNTTMRWLDDRATGSYNVSYDIARSYIISQSVMVTYLAQCCGLTFEFQKYNYADVSSSIAFPADTRFNFGFVLAGLGTFSNFFGALGDQR